MCVVLEKTVWTETRLHVLRVLQGIAAFKNVHHLEKFLLSIQSSPQMPHMSLWISNGMCPLSRKNRTRLRCYSQVDNSNMRAILFAPLWLELHINKLYRNIYRRNFNIPATMPTQKKFLCFTFRSNSSSSSLTAFTCTSSLSDCGQPTPRFWWTFFLPLRNADAHLATVRYGKVSLPQASSNAEW